MQKTMLIPAGFKRLHLAVDIPDCIRCRAYILIEDPKGDIRLQKLLGFGTQILGIGQSPVETSIGGVPGEVTAGYWRIRLITFIADESDIRDTDETDPLEIDITITDTIQSLTEPMDGSVWIREGDNLTLHSGQFDWNQVFQNQSGWFKGDFHTHTQLSDGKETVAKAMCNAAAMNMDFYVPTEHNLIHTGWCKTDICILPGVEITTAKGHFNLFGITKMPEALFKSLKNKQQQLDEEFIMQVFHEAVDKNWLISINHPFLSIWAFQHFNIPAREISCLEIINDPTYPENKTANEKALHLWNAFWNEGYRLTGVGGSDAHNLPEERYEQADIPSIVGDPGTYVYCKKLTPGYLKKAVCQGHTCVSRFVVLRPDIYAGERFYLPGECLTGTGLDHVVYGLQITEGIGFREDYLDESGMPRVMLVVNGEYTPVLVKRIASGSWYAKIKISIDTRRWQWMRMEVRGNDNLLLGTVTPVYTGKKDSKYQTYGEILSLLEKEK